MKLTPKIQDEGFVVGFMYLLVVLYMSKSWKQGNVQENEHIDGELNVTSINDRCMIQVIEKAVILASMG